MELPKSNIKRSYLVNVIGSFDENKIKSMNKKIYGKEKTRGKISRNSSKVK